jgi:hypothetical protein
MFDSRYVLDPLLDSEQAATIVKVHRKVRPRYARIGCIAGLRVGKLSRFRASNLGHYAPHAVNS